MSVAGRRRGRERAVQILYQWAITSKPLDPLLELFWRVHEEPPEVREMAERLARGTAAGAEQYDRFIDRQAVNWRLDRMSAVDRSILRLGVYELLNEPGTPPAVVLNEGIELAKYFSGPEAGQFVNGILDGIRKRLEAGDEPPAATEDQTT